MEEYPITLRHFLHHTSGFPEHSISKISVGDGDDALRQTVKNLSGIELVNRPGARYHYATVNYDILGAVIEKVSGISFEKYLEKHILDPLGLDYTSVGARQDDPLMAVGYKKSFFKSVRYDSPVFRGNNPAGYVVSNGKDMAKWLQFQLAQKDTPLYPLIQKSHKRDRKVPPDLATLTSYASGWQVSLRGNDIVSHTGLNPNYTSYVGFAPHTGIGVAVLVNSNSNLTPFIGRAVMGMAHGRANFPAFNPPRDMDTTASVASYIMGIFLFLMVAFVGSILFDIIKGRRGFEAITLKKIGKLAAGPVILAPFVFGIYLVPFVVMNFSWASAFVWTPPSFKTAVTLLFSLVGGGYFCFVFSTLFPHKNPYIKSIPMLVILSFLTGGANAVVIFLITIALFTQIKTIYLLYYFGLVLMLCIIGRKVLQSKLIRLTFDIVFDLRMKMLEKIFYTSYEKFEKIATGRVFATLNGDTGQIGGSANMLITLITSIITTIGVFIYMSTIALWATLLTVGIISVIGGIYYVVSQKTRVYFDQARDTQNVYMGLLNGMNDGFKELSLQYNKRKEYKKDVEASCDEFCGKTTKALIKFVNAFLVGESLLLLVLGILGFGVPKAFPEISTMTLLSFIMVLLYLIGPINGILRSIPGIMQIRIAWERVTEFLKEIPANVDPADIDKLDHNVSHFDYMEAKDVYFEYETDDERESFTVGPIDFQARKGDIIFIIGGNGSGKTTLAKLLTGLYLPQKGRVVLDGKDINNYQLGEYFSVVFSDYHLFEKLYNVDLTGREEEVLEYLRLLKLDDKVVLENNTFSTLELSGGQKKRLALLQCYLEDRPIYLFDEIAADQDPEFRRFFYRDLLKRMKAKGKTVIAITHDDHYFDVADRIVKMDLGKTAHLEDHQAISVTK